MSIRSIKIFFICISLLFVPQLVIPTLENINPSGVYFKTSKSNTSTTVAPIIIENTQSVATPTTFQQLVKINNLALKSVENQDLSNIQFTYTDGSVIASWLESGNSNTATSSSYWLKLSRPIPALSNLTIDMRFYSLGTSVFNNQLTGEAPQLSSSYGIYDDGNNIFNNYINFAGTSLPTGWYSNITGAGGNITVNNGLQISSYNVGGSPNYLGSNWPTNSGIIETYLTNEFTNNGQDMIFVSSNSSTKYNWQANEVSYQNGGGLEVESNNGGGANILGTANPNPTLPSVIGVEGYSLYANYNKVTSINQNILANGYLCSSANTGYSANFSLDWIRIRAEPPNGIMPTVLLNSSLFTTTGSVQTSQVTTTNGISFLILLLSLIPFTIIRKKNKRN